MTDRRDSTNSHRIVPRKCLASEEIGTVRGSETSVNRLHVFDTLVSFTRTRSDSTDMAGV